MPSLLPFPLASLWRLNDEQAMRRVQASDDEAAFAQLVQRWEEPIRRLCTRMTSDEHLGQDLAQEAFARVYLHRKGFRSGSKFSTWLWRIALNLCHDELRRRRRRSETMERGVNPIDAFLDEVKDEDHPAPDQTAQTLESVRLVKNALQRLAEPYRIVLVLRHYENLKFREIAEVLDIPEGTVKSRMTEALRQLAKLLRPTLEPAPAIDGTPPIQPNPLVIL